jgi:hypothetical protein
MPEKESKKRKEKPDVGINSIHEMSPRTILNSTCIYNICNGKIGKYRIPEEVLVFVHYQNYLLLARTIE